MELQGSPQTFFEIPQLLLKLADRVFTLLDLPFEVLELGLHRMTLWIRRLLDHRAEAVGEQGPHIVLRDRHRRSNHRSRLLTKAAILSVLVPVVVEVLPIACQGI